MSDHFEKIVQMLNKQNHRFDQIEESIGAIFNQIVKIEQNQNRLISMAEDVSKKQAVLEQSIEMVDERSTAEMELFLRLSRRVDKLESSMTPVPANGSGGY